MRPPLTGPELDAVLEALDTRGRALGCVIDLDRAGARTAPGRAGPLQGLCVGVKGNIAVRGLANTAGSAARRHALAAEDAAVVATLRAAGAAVVATLNMHEGALGATTANPAFGDAQNPWRAGHTPGGSSGGSAAAVAAGLVDAAFGTDTMGSIRIPAAYCGVFGYKPGGDWMDLDGIVPLCAGLDAVGPITGDADTLQRVATALGAPAPEPVRGLTMAVLEGLEPPMPGIGEALEAGAARLAAAGVRIVRTRLEGLPPLATLVRAGLLRCEAEGAAIWARELADPDSGLSPGFRALLDYGRRLDPARLVAAEALHHQTRQLLEGVFVRERLDAILLPTAAETAFAHGAPAPLQAGHTVLASLARLPAVQIPAGLVDGLPVGFQVVAAPGRDGVALGAAGLFPPLSLAG